MKYNGFNIVEEGGFLDKSTLNKHELKLLASGDGVEIMIQEIDENITFDIYPSEQGSTMMEFFYILEGELSYLPVEGKQRVLKKGEYFYFKQNINTHLFKTNTKVKMLYVSSQPVFHFLSDYLSNLFKVINEVEKKDKYTHNHSDRVCKYAVKIAYEMGINRDIITNVAIASLFHDVGKVLVPDYILNKAGKLTEHEFEIIKKHPKYSADFIKDIKYADVMHIVKQHHERLDGSGYPNGLKSDEICLEAKIIAVADTFDAMTSDRPYRKALSNEIALDELISLSGKHFDKDIVISLIKVLEKECSNVDNMLNNDYKSFFK